MKPAWPVRIVSDSSSQSHDMIVHGTERCLRVEAANLFDNIDAANHFTAVLRQHL
jgi:hypothetical protein